MKHALYLINYIRSIRKVTSGELLTTQATIKNYYMQTDLHA
jgi:hypothetical protein